MASASQPAPLDRSTVLALGAMAAAVFVVANDVTAMSVALPTIEKDFDADVTDVQWVVNAYAAVFGVLIVTGGRLADLYGRRRLFFVGAGIFSVFSLLGALAPDIWWLVGCRALMGIGGAIMWPAVLGMTFALLGEERAGLAGGLVLGAAGVGNAAGPLIGGGLTDALGWRAILLVNLPVAGFTCLAAWRLISESKADQVQRGFDVAGVATLSLGVVALLVALDELTDLGLGDPRIVGLLVLFVVLLTAFAFVERHAGEKALIPREIFANRPFVLACVVTLLSSAVFFAALVYMPQFMQKVLDYSPVKAGVGLLPMMGVFAATSFAAGGLYERLGARTVLLAGSLCLTLGPLLITLVERGSGYVELLPGMVVIGVGVGLFYSAITTTAVTALDSAHASLASGLVYMFQVAGGSVGLGLTTAVFAAGADDRLSDSPLPLDGEERDAVLGILAGTDGAGVVRDRFPAAAGELEELARQAFTQGLQWGFGLAGALAAVALVVTLMAVGRKRGQSS